NGAIKALMAIGANDRALAFVCIRDINNQAAALDGRCRAALYLGYGATNVPAAIEALRACTDDLKKPPKLRCACISALAWEREGAREAVPSLVHALSDPDAEVRSAANNALAQIAPDVLAREHAWTEKRN